MKAILNMLIILLAVYGGWSIASDRLFGGEHAEATPTPIYTATATPAATVAPSLAIKATPTAGPTPTAQRVQFPRGSYGDTITGSGRGRYLLWAKEAQVLTIESMSGDNIGLTLAVDGAQTLQFGDVGGKPGIRLPVSGDYVMDVSASGTYTVAVEIR